MNFLKLNINDDNYNLSDWMIIYEKIGQRPNKIIVHDTFVTKLFLEVISKEEEKNGLKELLPIEDDYTINEKILSKIYEDIWVSYVIIGQNLTEGSDNSIINDVCFYYKEFLLVEVSLKGIVLEYHYHYEVNRCEHYTKVLRLRANEVFQK